MNFIVFKLYVFIVYRVSLTYVKLTLNKTLQIFLNLYSTKIY